MIRGRAVCLLLVCTLLPLLAHAQGPSCTPITITPPSGNAPLSINATGSCAPGAAPLISITINWQDGTAFSSVDPTQPSYSVGHTYSTAGTFTPIVTATDATLASGTNSGTVTVNQAPQPPTCSLRVRPSNGTAPQLVTATFDCEPGSNPIQSVTLDWGDGTTVNEPAGPSSDTHTYVTPNTYRVTITALDSGGQTGTANDTVTVTAPQPQPPVCSLNLSANSGTVPLVLNASGTCTDPQGALTSVVLDWDDGTQTNIPVSNPDNFGPLPHTYFTQGTFHPRVTASDAAGLSGSASKTVTVGAPANLPPNCTLNVSATSGQVPLTVTATGNCVDPENDINRVIYIFGDGYYQAGTPGQSTATHTFVNAGNFAVQVVATDSGGNTAAAQQNVSTSDNPPLFVAVSNGRIKQFGKDGSAQSTLTTNLGGSTTGMSQDSLLNLYVTDFTANMVTRFGGHGGLIGNGNFGSGYNCKPESIVFDGAGNAYVGETGCSHAVLKFDAYGNLVAAYSVGVGVQGSDWIDLAPDQCTLYYTSQGSTVLRYNVCTNKQLSNFAGGLNTGLGLRVLPDNTVLVAEKTDILRLDPSGNVIKTYDAAGDDCWVSLSLDSDGTSFWAVDYCSSNVVQFDISSGNQRRSFNTGTAANTAFGIYTRGPNSPPSPGGPLVGPAQAVTVSAGQSGVFNLTFIPNPGTTDTFTFSCGRLPLGASCSFSPPTVTATPGATPITLTVKTTGASASLLPSRVVLYAMWLPMFGVVAVAAGSSAARRKRRLLLAFTIGILLAGLIFLVACGGGGSSSSNNSGGTGGGGTGGSTTPPTPGTSTPPGTYTFTVTGTSGSSQSSTTLLLTVQ